MKKLILLFAFMLAGVLTYAQRTIPYTFDADTLDATETINFAYPSSISADYVYSVGVTATELAGTPTVTSKMQVLTQSGQWKDYIADSTVISAGTPNEGSYILYGDYFPFDQFRIQCAHGGTTTGDTTAINVKVILKRKW